MSAHTLAAALDHLVTACLARNEYLSTEDNPSGWEARQRLRTRYTEAMSRYWSGLSAEDLALTGAAVTAAMDGDAGRLQVAVDDLDRDGSLSLATPLHSRLARRHLR